MTNKVNSFKKELSNLNIEPPEIHVFSLAGMDFGIKQTEKELGLKVICPTRIKKGISEVFTCKNEIKEKIELMKNMESSLQIKYKHNAFTGDYSLGYEGSEALFQVQFTNCPNNVFPIFWMGPRKKGKFRSTLFYRL